MKKCKQTSDSMGEGDVEIGVGFDERHSKRAMSANTGGIVSSTSPGSGDSDVPPSHEITRSRPGAFAIEGIGHHDTNIGVSDYDSAFICDNTELVTARAVHREPSPHPEILTAELMEAPESQREKNSTLCTRRRYKITAVVAALLIGVVAGVLYAIKGPCSDCKNVTAPQKYLDTIRPPGRDEGDRFADFVVISRDGTTIAGGAEEGNYVQVYKQTPVTRTWQQLGQTINGSGPGDQFGKAVDLNRDGSMVIGGAWNNDDAASDAGHARVFRLDEDDDDWKQVGNTLVGRDEGDHFGWYVSIADDGRTVAASAPWGEGADGKKEAGYVRVFTLDSSSGNWTQLGEDLTGENEHEEFGRAFAFDAEGRRLAVGTTRSNKETGTVRIYDYGESGWQRVGLDISGSQPGDRFGSGVALSSNGDTIVLGADGVSTTGGYAGLVRVFRLVGNTWQQYGQDILGEESGAKLGLHQVSLSDDGKCLVAGAKHVDAGTGRGYFYSLRENAWKKVVEVNGDKPDDELGESVSVSGDCSVAVFGAREFKTARTGYVRVYDGPFLA